MEYFKIILFVIFLLSIASFISLAPWVPTRKDDLDRIVNIIKLKKGEKFLEMGCGTANVAFYFAKNNPDSFITGIELSPFLYLISKIKVIFSSLDNIEIKYGNALKLDLKKFDVIYVFGLPDTITNKVFPIIKSIKNKNFRLISYCFQMKNNHFIETKYKSENRLAIYEYRL